MQTRLQYVRYGKIAALYNKNIILNFTFIEIMLCILIRMLCTRLPAFLLAEDIWLLNNKFLSINNNYLLECLNK